METLYLTRSRLAAGLIRPPVLSALDEQLLALLDTELRLLAPANAEAREARNQSARERKRSAFAKHWAGGGDA